jgi:phage baseplate assembly protein W
MPAPSKVITGFRRVQIGWGQTLQELAAAELGDAALWTTIAAINRLKPPWIVAPDDPRASPSVARYGDTIMVQDSRPDIEVGALSAEEIFKADVALPKGQLSVVNGDIELVAGRPNLRQALEHRIRVPLGELIFHPGYGCAIATLRGKRNDAIIALVGAKYVERAIATDDRIDTVTKVVVTPNGDELPVEAEAMTVTGHPINVETIA